MAGLGGEGGARDVLEQRPAAPGKLPCAELAAGAGAGGAAPKQAAAGRAGAGSSQGEVEPMGQAWALFAKMEG